MMKKFLKLDKSNSDILLSTDEARVRWLIFLGYIIILGIICQYLKVGIPKTPSNFMITFIPASLGLATGIGIIPFIIELVRKTKSKKSTNRIFFIYFTISTIVFFAYVSSQFKQKSFVSTYLNDYKTAESLEQKTNVFVYHYTGNEYTVSFERKPKIKNSSAPFNGAFLKAETAELVMPENKSFCRVECFNLDKSNIFKINKEYVYNYLNEYSVYNGLSYPTFEFEESILGKIGTLRAYKTLTGEDRNNIKVTFVSKSFWGAYSVMIIYVGCPSENYPTSSISKFINSVSKYNG